MPLDQPILTKKSKRVIFERKKTMSFQEDVNQRVDDYFSSNQISRNANANMIAKTTWIIAGWVAAYLLIVSNLVNPIAMLFLAMAHGFLTAMIGINIGHDALHGSYSKNRRVNKKLGLSFNIIGANDYVWNISHNVVHHTFTNIPHHDEDIHPGEILRIEPTQELKRFHRFQHVYAFFLYCLTSISWILLKDYKKFFSHELGAHYREKFPKKEIVRLVTYKVIYYTIFIVLPFVLIDLAWYYILLGMLAAHFVQGFTLSVIFMLAHIIEGTSFMEPDEDEKIDLPWADFQLHTTANFGSNNWVLNYFFGGLNFQIEHHLFPKTCHIHYPKISKIVKQTAKDHNLPYIDYPTFTSAVKSHVRTLRRFGTAA